MMRYTGARRLINALRLVVMLPLGLISSDSGAQRSDSAGVAPQIELRNLEMRDQHGSTVRFASDVIGDKIVALNFVYTSCQTACPVVSAIFSRLHEQLGEKLQSDVRLVSISINPLTDTPVKLNEQAGRYHAGPDWIWLTGEKQHIDAILKGLGAYTADYSSHAPLIIVGDPLNGRWTRFFSLPSPMMIATKIDELLAARQLQNQKLQ